MLFVPEQIKSQQTESFQICCLFRNKLNYKKQNHFRFVVCSGTNRITANRTIPDMLFVLEQITANRIIPDMLLVPEQINHSKQNHFRYVVCFGTNQITANRITSDMLFVPEQIKLQQTESFQILFVPEQIKSQ
jgi:hypothetical protein